MNLKLALSYSKHFYQRIVYLLSLIHFPSSTFAAFASSARPIFFSPSTLLVPICSVDCLTSGFSSIVVALTFADSAVSGATAAGDGLTTSVSILSSLAVPCLGVGSYISATDSFFSSGASADGFDSSGLRLAALSGAAFETGIVYSVVGYSAAFADPLSASSSATGPVAAGSGT